MNVVLVGGRSKHLFGKSVDTEQVFVMGCRHGEHRFDPDGTAGGPDAGVTPATYNVHGSRSDAPDDPDDDRKDLPMTALLTASLPEYLDEPARPGRPDLRLLPAPERKGLRLRPAEESEDLCGRGGDVARRPHRRVSAGVRRRRALLAMMGLALALLAFPLGGFGGASHTAESASAAQIHGSTYIVQPGDSLWTIAERVDPKGDPRPLVSEMASKLGSYTVVPGEQITIP